MRGEKIKEREPGEKRIVQVLQLVTGWLSIRENQMVILLALRTREAAIKEPKGPNFHFRIGSGEDVRSAETALLQPSLILAHGSARYRIEPPVPFLALPRPITRLEASAPAECRGANLKEPSELQNIRQKG